MTDDKFELTNLEVSVIGDPDSFVCSHKLGKAFDVVGENLIFNDNNAFSLYALSALLPLIPAKRRQTHPNDWMTTDQVVACPDPNCGAQFQIARKDKKTFSHAEVTKVPLPNQN